MTHMWWAESGLKIPPGHCILGVGYLFCLINSSILISSRSQSTHPVPYGVCPLDVSLASQTHHDRNITYLLPPKKNLLPLGTWRPPYSVAPSRNLKHLRLLPLPRNPLSRSINLVHGISLLKEPSRHKAFLHSSPAHNRSKPATALSQRHRLLPHLLVPLTSCYPAGAALPPPPILQ